MKFFHSRSLFAAIIFSCAISPAASAATPGADDSKQSTALPADTVIFTIPSANEIAPRLKVPQNSGLGHFTWGIDAGSSIDMTANDMTAIALRGYFGYKGHALRLLGVGAGIDIMVNNSSRCYPIFAILRTSFSSKPRLCFLDLRAGICANNILDYKSRINPYASIGLGITLAHGRKFSSHILLSYTFQSVGRIHRTILMPDTSTREDFSDESFDTPASIAARAGIAARASSIATRASDSAGSDKPDSPSGAPASDLIPVTDSTFFPHIHYASISIGCSF